MEEKEAKNKKCPISFANVSFGADCKGSSCMAWRWRGVLDTDETGIMRITKGNKGYCGLAGKETVEV